MYIFKTVRYITQIFMKWFLYNKKYKFFFSFKLHFLSANMSQSPLYLAFFLSLYMREFMSDVFFSNIIKLGIQIYKFVILPKSLILPVLGKINNFHRFIWQWQKNENKKQKKNLIAYNHFVKMYVVNIFTCFGYN